MPGKILGTWRIIRQLGAGCLGTVYLAKHVDSGRKGAVKVFPRELSSVDGFTGRFNERARLLKQLDHPGIAKITDYGCDESLCYLVMEYVWGPSGEPLTLEQYLQEHGGTLPEGEIAEYTGQLSKALQYAHSPPHSDSSAGPSCGIPHGSLKPANILLDRNMKAVITDFGLVDMVGSSGLEKLAQDPEKSRQWLQSRYYFSPEQINGEQVTHRSDIFSLGIIIYQMITGKVPFGPFKRPGEARADINRNWDRVVDRCLQQNPEDRLPEAGQILGLLEAKHNKKKGFWKVAVACALAVCLCVWVFFLFRGSGGDGSNVRLDESDTTIAAQKAGNGEPGDVLQGERIQDDEGRTGSNVGEVRDRHLHGDTEKSAPAKTVIPGKAKDSSTGSAVVLPPGKIKISSVPSEARIFLDGREFGLTPYQSLDNEIKAGIEHVLVIKKSGYADRTVRFSIQDRSLHDLGVVTLEKAQGLLSVVSSPPGADVYLLKGTFLGKTPIEKMSLDIGEYTVLLRKSDFRDEKVFVEIQEEQETRIEKVLEVGIKMAVRILLEEASRQMVKKQYIAPAGQSAIDIYREILEVDKDNPQAREGIERIYQYYLLKGDALLTALEFERARSCFRTCVDILPNDSRAKIKLIKVQEKEFAAAQKKAAPQPVAPQEEKKLIDSVWNTFSPSPTKLKSSKSDDGKSYVQIELDMTCGGAFELGFQKTYVIYIDGVEKGRFHDMPAQKVIHFTTPRIQVEPGDHRVELWYYVKEGILGNINRKSQIFSTFVEKGTILNLYLKKDVHD